MKEAIRGQVDDVSRGRRLSLVSVLLVVIIVLRPTLDITRSISLGPLSGTDIVGAMIICLAGGGIAFGELNVPRTEPAYRLLRSYLWYAILAGIVYEMRDSGGDLTGSILRLFVLIMGMIAFYHIGAIRFELGPRLLAFMFLIPVVFGAYQAARGQGLQPDPYGPAEAQIVRAVSTFSHPNVLATFAGFGLCAAFFLVRGGAVNGPIKLLWIIVGFCSAISVVGSYTRSVWVAVPVAVIIASASASRRILAGAGLVVIGVVVYSFDIAHVVERVSGGSSVTFREQLWSALLAQENAASYIFGFGVGRIDDLVLKVSSDAHITAVDQVHNDYLRILFETGIVGFVLYGLAIIYALRAAWEFRAISRDHKLAHALSQVMISWIVILLLVSASDNVYQDVVLNLVFWSMVGLGLGCRRALLMAKGK